MMKTWILIGDILHPGKVQVEAETIDQAIAKAERGDFEVYDEMHKCLAFAWNGDEDTVQCLDSGDENLCPHGENPALCNECRGGPYEAAEAAPWETPCEGKGHDA